MLNPERVIVGMPKEEQGCFGILKRKKPQAVVIGGSDLGENNRLRGCCSPLNGVRYTLPHEYVSGRCMGAYGIRLLPVRDTGRTDRHPSLEGRYEVDHVSQGQQPAGVA